MKKRLILLLALTVLSAALLAGCGSKTGQDDPTDNEQTQQPAGPQTDTDEQGDADADRESELNGFFLGEHKRSSDGSVLTIAENEDGTFAVALSITRLCSLENGVGTFADHKMTFTVTDPADNEMTGEICREDDDSLSMKITDSTWELLPAGEILDGFGK